MAEKTSRQQSMLSLFKQDELMAALLSDMKNVSKLAAETAGKIEKGQVVTRPANPLPELTKLQAALAKTVAEKGAAKRDKAKQRSEALQKTVELTQKRLEAYAKRKRSVIPALGDKFVVAGQVTDKAGGRGIPNLTVKAIDMDRKYDDQLGTTRTDALGYYRIEYSEADFKDRDKKPETFIEVLDDEQEVLYRSPRSFIEKAGQTEKIDAEIDGSKVPDKLALGQKVNTFVDNRLTAFSYKRQVLDGRKRILTEKIRPTVKLKTRPGLSAATQPLGRVVEKAPAIPKRDTSALMVEEAQVEETQVKDTSQPAVTAATQAKKPVVKKTTSKAKKTPSRKTSSKKTSKKKK